jgi:hypothetical protein
MSADFDSSGLDATERELFAALPRELPADRGEEDALVSALRREGFFAQRPAWRSTLTRVAAAALLALGSGLFGALIGARIATRSSLEAQLARADLSIADRTLLLQRAGSAYVQAAHGYADATAQSDSTAVEVARQVLLGAAHAVVRGRLDRGIATSLTKVLHDSVARRAAQPGSHTSPLIWY